jgi:heptosyltransferase-2
MIKQASVVVTNDSGPMHIAAALAKPQIALFGATTPQLGFAPLNEKAIVLCQNLPCQPCSLHGQETCPKRHFACMLSIKPEAIIAALNTLETA